jgi:hypothetical protein
VTETRAEHAQIAREMLDLLDEGRGWLKGSVSDVSRQRRCMLGAYQRVIELRRGGWGGDWWTPFVAALEQTVREQYPERVRRAGLSFWSDISDPAAVSGFNDHEDTTWDDVRVVLEKMAVQG